MNGKILSVTQDEYFADPCVTPSLDPSIGNILVSQSPRHAWYAHPRLGGIKRKPSQFMDSGSLIHALLLGDGKEIVEIHAKDFKTKVARQQRDEAHEAGLIPVLTEEISHAREIIDDVRLELEDQKINISGGQSEMMVQWEEEATNGNTVLCRGMLDKFIYERATIFDVKAVSFGKPEVCQANSIKRSDSIQINAYMSGIASLHPELMGRLQFVFLFVECLGPSGKLKSDPPYCVSPLQPDGILQELSMRKWQQAIDLWEECLRTDTWPGYADRIISMTAPMWALREYEISVYPETEVVGEYTEQEEWKDGDWF